MPHPFDVAALEIVASHPISSPLITRTDDEMDAAIYEAERARLINLSIQWS